MLVNGNLSERISSFLKTEAFTEGFFKNLARNDLLAYESVYGCSIIGLKGLPS